MKNLLTSAIVGSVMIFTGTAQAGNFSEFRLKMFDNSAFSIKFDGAWMSQQTPSFSIAGISPGTHNIEVVKYFFSPHGGMQPQLIFSGNISIPPRSKVVAMISCENIYKVEFIEPLHGNQYGGNNGGWGQNTGYGNNGGGWNGNDPYGNGYRGGYGSPIMPLQAFQQLKYAIDSKSFESSKLQVAKQSIAMNYFSSVQVAELMDLMDFESTRLAVAEFAYPRTVDKQNYYLVNNSFSFESSIGQLNYYIAHL